MSSTPELPKSQRALVLHSTNEPPKVEVIPTPQPTPGSVIVRILVASVLPYTREIYDGTRQYAFPIPLVIGSSAIGRVAAVGPDTTFLKPGQLVHVDVFARGRDDPTALFLFGVHEGFTEGSKKLMHGEWRDATYAEYAKMPLENCDALDETRLLGSPRDGGLGYNIEDLQCISALLVPYGGLRDIDLKAGETVVIAPATGAFGGAAVLVALAMGARVIAIGRNVEALKKVAARSERIEAVPMTGDVQKDMEALREFGPADAFLDISPPAAAKSTHIKSGILSLRHSGRVSLMGGFREDIAIPYSAVMHRNLVLRGKWMYDREYIRALIKMVEIGVLKLGEGAGCKTIGKFELEDWKTAFDTAAENPGMGMQALITP